MDPPAAEVIRRSVEADAKAILDAVDIDALDISAGAVGVGATGADALRGEAVSVSAIGGDALSPTGSESADLTDLTDLTERQRAILDFERLWWKRPGAKEQAIRDHFDVSPNRYYQALNALLELPQAMAYDAALINRLQRVRDGAPRARRRPR